MTYPLTTPHESTERSSRVASHRRPWLRVGAVATVALAATPLSIGVAGATARHGVTANVHSTSHSNLSVFCSALKPAKLGAALGGTVKLTQSLVRGGILTCIFKAPGGFVSVEYQAGVATSTYAKLSTAKAAIARLFGPSVKATVKADTAFGGHAYYWTAKIGGAPYSGLNYYKNDQGWFIEMPGKLQLAKLENVERIADKA